ncbi:MAG: alpha/beta hydrolase [bacterium]
MKMKKTILSAFRILTAFYVVAMCILFGVQRHLLYAGWGHPFPDLALDPDVERVWIDIDEGRVPALFLKGASPRSPLVVYTHGNGTLAELEVSDTRGWKSMGYAVLIPEYRGYGKAAGSPSQTAIVADTLKMIDLVCARPTVDCSTTIYHGRSLGGGVAAALAQKRPPNGLVLESTFTSIRAFAKDFYAPPFVVLDGWDTVDFLPEFKRPVLILHGDVDNIVPLAHSALNQAASPTASRHVLRGHHILATDDAYWNVVREWAEASRLPFQRLRK